MLYLKAFAFPCLHITTSFLSLHPYGLGGLYLISRGVSTSWAPRVVCLSWFHWLDSSNCVRPDVMNSWAQLLFKLSPLGDLSLQASPFHNSPLKLHSLYCSGEWGFGRRRRSWHALGMFPRRNVFSTTLDTLWMLPPSSMLQLMLQMTSCPPRSTVR